MAKITMQGRAEEISFSEAFDQFIRYKKIHNLSEETLSYYNWCKKKFGDFFNLDNSCSDIDEETVYSFIEYMQQLDPPIKDVTINSYLRGMRSILNYCMDKGYIRKFTVKLIKVDKDIKETYSESELEILLKKPNPKNCTFVEFRDWAITNFFLGTGIRVSSIVNIKIGDIDFQSYEIKITKVKNRKQQIIPLSQALSNVMKEYLNYRGGEDDDYLFPNQFGGMLTKSALQTSISIYNRRRGVDKTSSHVYRHTFAKLWILNGGDIFTLQKLLGHSSLDVVKEYVNMFGTDVKQQYNKFNALDNMVQNQENGAKIKMKKK